MFALIDAYPYYQLPEFCNSMCVYVKLSELKPLVEQWNNGMDTINMRQMTAQGLQKYCFMDSEEVQTICAEPDMNVLEEMLNGGGFSYEFTFFE